MSKPIIVIASISSIQATYLVTHLLENGGHYKHGESHRFVTRSSQFLVIYRDLGYNVIDLPRLPVLDLARARVVDYSNPEMERRMLNVLKR